MYKFLISLFFCFCSISYLLGDQPVLILNMANEEALPHVFRTCKDPFSFSFHTPSRRGLDDLKMSGSSQFSELSMKMILKKLNYNGPIIDVDLRGESHGFINGIAVSWYGYRNWTNRKSSIDAIKQDENSHLDALKDLKEITITKILSHTSDGGINEKKRIQTQIRDVTSEEEITKRLGIGYQRFYITDHARPSDDDIDAFIVFVKQLPKDTWLHFHCQGGVGRTTTFMCLYDMMHNAKNVSFEDIVQRQTLIGGRNLLRLSQPDNWKFPDSEARANFIKDFYEYAKENSDSFKTSWSQYKKNR